MNDERATKISDDCECGPSEADSEVMRGPGVLVNILAELPEKAILDEARLAHLLHVTPRTIRRMVGRFELPPPVSLGGRSVWMAGRVLGHIDAAAERKQRVAEQQARKFRETVKTL